MNTNRLALAAAGGLAVIILALLAVLYANGVIGQPKHNQITPAVISQEEENPEEQLPPGQVGNDLSGFLRDETFFDTNNSNHALDRAENEELLSLLTVSVQRDIRISVLGEDGEPVTGQSFRVRIEKADEDGTASKETAASGTPSKETTADGASSKDTTEEAEVSDDDANEGEYRDLDQDGVIYAGGLAAGEYQVSLMPIAGYRIPVQSTNAHVKERVEYIPIDDISALILTEADIDAKKEDTGVAEAEADADRSEDTSLKKGQTKTKVGIDVSKWQKEIDWEKVAEDGVQFAIIRCGYRGSSTGALVEDPYFKANIRGAQKAGLEVGVYFFTQAINEVEAVEEASAVIELVREYELDLPVYIDTEGAGGNGRADNLNTELRTTVCDAFCRTIQNAGLEAGIYASRNWFNKRLDMTKLDRYDIWLAEYRDVPLYEGYYSMWQHTSKGAVTGIEGYVDLDIRYE